MQVSNQIALVSGGGSGLGAATARVLAAQGARVAVLDYDGDKAKTVAAEIDGIAVRADVGDEAQVAAAFEEVAENLGVPRIAVSCAGIGLAARVVGREGKLSTDLFERVIRVNLIGSYFVMSHAAKGMQGLDPLEDGERGVIINTSSAAYEDGQLGQTAYAASKGGIASMCLPAAREFAKTGIRVMAIAPGLFYTPMMEGLPTETVDAITANIPFPARLGKAEEFGQLVSQIVANPYLNGTVIRLDGAVRLPPR
ncbi:SDR family NAD(P)-dependent oxidoreductase [Yoonia sediminilitoris]|uniref:NAD(P)-dependent dehydrogenase (Short-subunit alcohol dehydrogenase family) n=1 Tax=Yoonia sediminilitoris TaxID=1286148 RepID=A0A2T6KIC5_9RHOB|nr:SDR family NAD(P)-dependent oxidoreductase [Yoonia sediminilitoris]PUB15458.1 NAD(P)-dependent dehydrogenase (short-subunit alcohol dehydrogenase family) [Yoonia sediminilitoris]RCW96068.1 NAD(P)-dependent dehydrogenase (short-subunit alcohol dehydrogenase family) [Yoonia sediminilitoris]